MDHGPIDHDAPDDSSPHLTRRRFLGGVIGTAAATAVFGPGAFGLERAWAGAPTHGSLDDVQHVVILMQENRSFDHYYGTMAGVRGFSDKTALTLPSGNSVLKQPDLLRLDGGYLLPFHLDTAKVDGQDLSDLAHDWDTTHIAVNGGVENQWVLAKSEMTMGYFTEADIPFHRALAQAFTICDNYHCSIQGPTIPNRLYLWTGTIDPAGTNGGPATWNPSDYQPVYSWTTYPERLQSAGVSWQVYANNEVGDGSDGWVGDYGDNPLWLFEQYHDALASTDPAVQQLALRANLNNGWLPDSGQGQDVDHVLSQFLTDCAAGTLPQVSWVVAPQDYSEHPSARPADGAAYVEAVLQGIWGNPDLRDSTVVFLNYDENDGFFDHLPPPLPPAGTPEEFLPASQPLTDGFPPAFGSPTPIGLGPRVPMTVISPWSRGGWVNSEVFDHTSVLRFLETWTGVAEPNISAWRRTVCGDLTSCFDFTSFNVSVPSLPDANALRAAADQTQPTLPTPTTPGLGQQVAPVQDPGTAPARPLPYQPVANFIITSVVTVVAGNQGTQSVHLSVYPDNILPVTPQQFDVAPGGQAVATSDLDFLTGAYDVWVYGPNGFSAHGGGNVLTTAVGVEATLSVVGGPNYPELDLKVTNTGSSSVTVLVTELDGDISAFTVAAGGQQTVPYDPLSDNQGWYDLTVEVDNHPNFVRQFTGHLENGQPSFTG